MRELEGAGFPLGFEYSNRQRQRVHCISGLHLDFRDAWEPIADNIFCGTWQLADKYRNLKSDQDVFFRRLG